MNGVLHTAAELLRAHYGVQPKLRDLREWTTLVRVVLEHGRDALKKDVDWSWLADSPLALASDTATSQIASLANALEAAKQPANKAAALHALAKWCVDRESNTVEATGIWEQNLAALRDELRGIRGVNIELADRILLFVGGRAAYPVDRASTRIACRHGWLDLSAEYDERQSFFVRGCENDVASLAQLSQWNARIRKDFCGPRPQCDECPLRSLLPEKGPVEIDEG